jgi:hypothetical protein
VSNQVEMTGVGTASEVPDVVRLDLSVRCEGSDVSAALGDTARRIEALGTAALDHGVAPTDLQTSGAGVHPRHDQHGVDVIGYTAFESLRVTVRDMVRVGDLVQAFTGAAGNALTVERIALEVSDPAPLAAKARAAAFKDAERKATQFAELADRTLGKVVAVVDVDPSGGPHPRAAFMAAKTGGALPVQPGENTVTATVVVRWDWMY